MSEPKWTPGPWLRDGRTVYALEHAGWRKSVEQFKNRFYASVQQTPTTPEEEIEANARLIATAPELYAALDKCARWMGTYSPALSSDSLDTALVALAKARGEA